MIGINRPEVRNCVNLATAEQLSHAIEHFENDPESPIGILYGVGGNFCSGYDLKELVSKKEQVQTMLLRSEGAMVNVSIKFSGTFCMTLKFHFRVQQDVSSRNL